MELGRVVDEVAADEAATTRDDDVVGMEDVRHLDHLSTTIPHKAPEHHGHSPRRSLEQ